MVQDTDAGGRCAPVSGEDVGTLCTSCCEPETVLKMKVDYFREQFKRKQVQDSNS